MSEFNEGRVAATFQVGHRIEDIKEAYEKEIASFESMKSAFSMAGKSLEDYILAVKQELEASSITVKESEYAMKYIFRCIDVMKKLFMDAEAKRLAATGAVEALGKAVADVKRAYDSEREQLKKIHDFETADPKDIKDRPVGYMPKESTAELADLPVTAKKKTKKSVPEK